MGIAQSVRPDCKKRMEVVVNVQRETIQQLQNQNIVTLVGITFW